MFPRSQCSAFETRLIADAAMTMRDDLIHDRLAADAGQGRFARGINVGDDNAIGVIEGAPKLRRSALVRE